MFKFLRKYNKWILAVGGTLLMIVFLIPQAIEGLAQRAGVGQAVRAEVGTERVPAAHWIRISHEAEFLDRLGRALPVLPQIGGIESPAHWFLLVREAEAAGLVPAPESMGLGPEQMDQLRTFSPAGPEVVRTAMARLEGVEQLLRMYHASAEVSDRRLRQYAARTFHIVEADLAVIQATPDAVDADFDESELQRHLEQHQDDLPGEGPMGFGYRMPHRVKLEWLRISADSIREAVAEELVGEDGEMGEMLWYHWMRQARDPDWTLARPGDLVLDEENDEALTIPEDVREVLLTRLTETRLEEISRAVTRPLRESRRGLAERDGYLVLPEDWPEQRPDFTLLARDLQQRLDIPLPGYRSTGEQWLTIPELDDLPGIGRASTERFGLPRTLRDMVAAAKEFGGSPIMIVQEGVAGPILRSPDGSIFIFRIVQADPSRRPLSLDEVRGQVETDLRRLAHFRTLQEQASAIHSLAAEDGLLALAIEYGALVEPATITLTDFDEVQRLIEEEGKPLMPVPSPLPVLGRHRAAVEALIDHAMSLPPDAYLDELPEQQRLAVVAVEDSLAIIAARFTRQMPLSREDYALLASIDAPRRMLLNEELRGEDALRDAFSLAALTRRHDFRLTRDRDDVESEEVVDAEL